MNISKIIPWIPTFVLLHTVITPITITGRSMSPTLNPLHQKTSDIVLLNKFSSIKPNDIVVLIHPNYPDKLIVKRVTRMNGHYNGGDGEIASVFVESDEPFHGMDSRKFGAVPQGLILGKVICILYPFHRFTIF